MPRTLTVAFAIASIPFFLASCAVPAAAPHSLAAPNHVVAAALDLSRQPARPQLAVDSFPALPDHRSSEFTARDCKRIAKANGDLPDTWRDGAAFTVLVGEESVAQRLMTTTVMPGASVTLEVLDRRRQASYAIDIEGGQLAPRRAGSWTWKAPRQPGLYSLLVVDRFDGESMCINAFVMQPYDGGRDINGFRVGGYPRRLLNGDPAYTPPTGFIEVHSDMRDIWVSPHFRLSQFLCKQTKGDPEYLLLSPRLLLKLEYLLARAHERGIRASTFQILSAFRTPWYNANIGNDTRYSRHAYGDAADIFIDEDGDGRMDDIDGDGRITARDADVLYELVEDSMHDHEYQSFQGGLSLYTHARHAGPFVHVDTRGTPIRWGKRIPQRSTPARMTQRAANRAESRF